MEEPLKFGSWAGLSRDTRQALFESSPNKKPRVIFRVKGKVSSPVVNKGHILPILLNFDIFRPEALACELKKLEQRKKKNDSLLFTSLFVISRQI